MHVRMSLMTSLVGRTDLDFKISVVLSQILNIKKEYLKSKSEHLFLQLKLYFLMI